MNIPSFSISCTSSCVSILNDCILSEFKDGNDQPLEASDFELIRNKIEVSSKKLYDLIREGVSDEKAIVNSLELNEFLLSILIYCGENASESYWTSSSTLNLRDAIYKIVFLNYESLLKVFVEDQDKILKKLLHKLRPCLLSESWKKYPTAVYCYIWCLNALQSPHIGENLQNLLPTSLIISDDFTVSNKIMGIKCLHHIVKNVTLTELQSQGYDEVIFKVLEMSLMEKDADLVSVLTPCLVTLLDKMYCSSTDHYGKWTHYDDILTKFIYNTKLEGNFTVKKSMVEGLVLLINHSGLLTVRYLKDLIEVVDEASVNYLTVLPGLQVCSAILNVCSPCIKKHSKQIAFIILKINLLSGTYKPLEPKLITDACIENLKLLHNLNPVLLQDLVNDNKFNELNNDICCIISEIINFNFCNR